jgi:hypothetical protein
MEGLKLEKSEQEKIQILRENLRVLDVLDQYSVLFHGTEASVVDKIFQEGLKYEYPALQATAAPLFDSRFSYQDQSDEGFAKILNWPHRGHKAIVVLAIPNVPEGESGGFSYFNSVFEENKNGAYVIPPEFIKGYIDVNNLKFVANPKYDPEKKVIVKKKSVISSHVEEENPEAIAPVSTTDIKGENNDDLW